MTGASAASAGATVIVILVVRFLSVFDVLY